MVTDFTFRRKQIIALTGRSSLSSYFLIAPKQVSLVSGSRSFLDLKQKTVEELLISGTSRSVLTHDASKGASQHNIFGGEKFGGKETIRDCSHLRIDIGAAGCRWPCKLFCFVLFQDHKMRIANLISFPVSLRVMQISGVSYNDFLQNYDCLVENLVNYIVRGKKLFSLFIHGYIPYAVNKKQVIFQVLHGNHEAFARGLQ